MIFEVIKFLIHEYIDVYVKYLLYRSRANGLDQRKMLVDNKNQQI